jgi:hypothetical protein
MRGIIRGVGAFLIVVVVVALAGPAAAEGGKTLRRAHARVTSWPDGRIVVERAVHGSLAPAYRITNLPRPAQPGGPVRILEWSVPGDRGGHGTIRFFPDGRRETTGTVRPPVR